MSSTAASGFVFLLLFVQVIQSQDTWRVTYTSTAVCGVKGSIVDISCSYTYPSRIKHRDIRKTIWFTKEKNGEPVDLMSDSEYSGRVMYRCSEKKCSLIIKNVGKSDAAEYKFMFTTNRRKDKHTGSPGVTLYLTDPSLKVIVSKFDSTRVVLKCLSGTVLPDRPSYIWYENGENIETGPSYSVSFGSSNSVSCAVKGPEKICSPPVYAPWFITVSVSPSTEIMEGSSVTLTCRSDANPAASYTWYKGNQLLSKRPQLVFSSIQSCDSGEYYCKAENQLGMKRSKHISIDVKYAPRRPSVSVSPSKIVKGSSVNLTCSSDAKPAASYTWYKEDEDLPKASGHIFIITNFRVDHSGKYSCEAQNTIGRSHSTFHLSVAAPAAVLDTTTMMLENTMWILVVLLLISLLLSFLWMRMKKDLISTTEPHESIELDVFHVYENISDEEEDTNE